MIRLPGLSEPLRDKSSSAQQQRARKTKHRSKILLELDADTSVLQVFAQRQKEQLVPSTAGEVGAQVLRTQ